MSGRSRRRGRLLAFLTFLFVWVALELLVSAAASVLGESRRIRHHPILVDRLSPDHRSGVGRLVEGEQRYLMHDAELGWTVHPSLRVGETQSNAQGFRASRAYALAPPPGVLRVAAFGDSFTHASEVGNAQAWSARLEALDPTLEVLNFGVGGYGPGQALLRYRRDGAAYAPHVVLIGFLSENISRSVSVYRPFYSPGTGIPLAKPRFHLVGGRLELLPNPLPALDDYRRLLDDPGRVLSELGRHDYFFRTRPRRVASDLLPSVRLYRAMSTYLKGDGIYRREGSAHVFDTRSEAYRVTLRVLQRFREEALANGSHPIFLLFSTKRDLWQLRRDGRVAHEPLRRELERAGHELIDPSTQLAEAAGDDVRNVFAATHYNELGNRVVARAVFDRLHQLGLVRASR